MEVFCDLAEWLSDKAERNIGKLRIFLLFDLLSLLWALFFAHRVLGMKPTGVIVIGIILAFPVVFTFRLYRMLRPIPALPGQLRELGGSLGQVVAQLDDNTLADIDQLKASLGERKLTSAQIVQAGMVMKRVAPAIMVSMRNLSSMRNTGVLESVAALATPVFPLIFAVSTVSSIALAGIAFLCLMVYPFVV
jgi:hypothetical protein